MWRLCFQRLCHSVKSVPPPPLRIGFTSSSGRGAFAARDIRSSELIYNAKPVVTHPALSSLGKVCSICLKRLQGHAEHCGFDSYCGQDCEDQAKSFSRFESSAHWSSFHEYCRANSLKFPLLVKRLACMVSQNLVSPDVLDVLYPPDAPNEVPEKWIQEERHIAETFSKLGLHHPHFLTRSWYAATLYRVHLNAFRVETINLDVTDLRTAVLDSVTGENSVGSAIYTLPSMFNHSCDPNVHIYWPENAVARMEALRDIQAGEEMTITYIDASMSFSCRQALLEQAYGFQCKCPRCLEKV